MGVVPINAFLRNSSRVPDFHYKNVATHHLTFAGEIRDRFALDDTNCDDHTGKGEQVYVYIHHAQSKHTGQESKQGFPYSR